MAIGVGSVYGLLVDGPMGFKAGLEVAGRGYVISGHVRAFGNLLKAQAGAPNSTPADLAAVTVGQVAKGLGVLGGSFGELVIDKAYSAIMDKILPKDPCK